MRISIVYNNARAVVAGLPDDLASDREMALVPQLVQDALTASGHDVTLVEADWNLLSSIAAINPDLVLNLAEGFASTNAHEHLVPSLLDWAGIPYTGADATNMLVMRDKAVTKEIMCAHGVRTAPWRVFRDESDCRQHGLRYPLILKPVREEASIGIRLSSVVRNEADLEVRVRELGGVYRQPILGEEFVVGRELSVGVWGNRVLETLPVCEFMFEATDPLEKFRSFEYKWLGRQELMGRAEGIPPAVLEETTRATTIAHIVLGCRDYSRADFRLSEANDLYFLEHNFNPGIGPNTHGLSNTFTRMAELANVSFGDMLERILRLAAGRYGGSCR